ncbi:MAG: flagellar type III secretion system pore protein FliP [Victivallales bacterium]|nr:flagellar type III secretion system pore protein FliP [Victivallales bacterium]
MRRYNAILLLLAVSAAGLLLTPEAMAQAAGNSPQDVSLNLSLQGGGDFTKAINILLLMTALSLAPAAIMMMTSFTRIVIVLSFLKQAMATTNIPSARMVSALALFLTIFIMQPVWSEIYTQAIEPYSKQAITQKEAMTRATTPLKQFMLRQTREASIVLFMELAGMEPVDSPEKLPMSVIIPAFMLSELKTAFQIGFLIYLPFLMVDVVVATTLMSMGMMMLPPMLISMPFKLLLFIIVDGWTLMVRSLVASFV